MDRLFAVDGRTTSERAATRTAQVAAQASLFDLAPDVAPTCPVCSGDHTDPCQHGTAGTLL